MKIRKYTGADAPEAIQKVKADLGSDALIISTKKVRQKGLLGFFKKPLTEVMAAVDEQAQAKAKAISGQLRAQAEKQKLVAPSNEVFARFQSQLQTGGQGAGSLGGAGGADAFGGLSGAAVQTTQTAAAQAVQAAQTAQAENPATAGNGAAQLEVYKEVNRSASANRHIGALANQVQPVKPTDPVDRLADLESKVSQMEGLLTKVYQEVSISGKMVRDGDNAEKLVPLTKVLQQFYNNLVKNEVEPEYSMNIIEKVSDSLIQEDNANDAATVLYNEVFAALGKPETINIRQDKKPTVVIFVGPTGVGKTTTLAKIAANYALNQGLKVGMITADTYRIAAVQQLQTYAEILNIPLSVIYAPGDIQKAITDYDDKDLVLIDTAGRSHRNKSQFDELKELMALSRADDIFLVLSSTSSMKNNREIIENYRFLEEFKLIFTKADETATLGMLLNTRMMTGKCLSYITVGQSVPDDIEVASADKIARKLIGSMAE